MVIGINKQNTALLFIECQQEWIGKDAKLRSLMVKDQGVFDQAIRNAATIITHARKKGWTIAHAGQDLSHDPEYLIFGRGHNKAGLAGIIPKAAIWGEDGARFIEPFIPQKGEFIVKGRSGASALKNSTLDPFLRNNNINTLILIGFVIHVCVESTLREAHDLGYNTYVVTDACGAFEQYQTEYFNKHIVHYFGESLTTADIIGQRRFKFEVRRGEFFGGESSIG